MYALTITNDAYASSTAHKFYSRGTNVHEAITTPQWSIDDDITYVGSTGRISQEEEHVPQSP